MIAHSEKENAAARLKRTFGFHSVLCSWTGPASPREKPWRACSRGAPPDLTTSADHIMLLDGLPALARPAKTQNVDPVIAVAWAGPRLLTRTDSAGAAHGCANVCLERGVNFLFEFLVDFRAQRIVDAIPNHCMLG